LTGPRQSGKTTLCRQAFPDKPNLSLEPLETRAFDLAILDGQMPFLSGYEVARALRSRPEFSSFPILALTAGALPSDRERAREAGMNDFLLKPVSREALREALARWLPSVSGTQQTVPAASEGAPILDRAAALRCTGGDREILAMVLEVFTQEWPAQRDRLRGALASGDAQELAAAAHRLKGSAGTIAAQRLHRLMAYMEAAWTAGHIDDAQQEVQRVEEEVGRLLAHIPPFLEEREAA
ncbi:MAG: response regulator, partial [Gemmatimonadetes bacterium]|nr:response regulator [Gemmatimonadota bacterium]